MIAPFQFSFLYKNFENYLPLLILGPSLLRRQAGRIQILIDQKIGKFVFNLFHCAFGFCRKYKFFLNFITTY